MSGRIVAIDYGLKRVGVAISDPLYFFAQPFGTFDPGTVIPALKDLAARDGIQAFVVGWPLTLEGTEGASTRFVQDFIVRLVRAFPEVPVHKWDERYTSEIAREAIVASGARRKARREKGRIDTAAAAIMLQEFLDARPKP